MQHFIGNDLENWNGTTRWTINTQYNPRDMRDTFMPSFEACITTNAASFMCSYNAGKRVV